MIDTPTQFLCIECNELVDTYDDIPEMLKHIRQHDRQCKGMNDEESVNSRNVVDGKLPIEELKSFFEHAIRNNDDSIDFLHNSGGKKHEDWYESWSLKKVKTYLGEVLYSPVCKKLCNNAEVIIGSKEFDKLLSLTIMEIVNGVW